MRKTFTLVYLLIGMGCGESQPTPRPLGAAATSPVARPVDPEERIRLLLKHASDILSKGKLTREEQVAFRAVTTDLAQTVWSDFQGIDAALRISPEFRDDPRGLELIEMALLQKPDPGGFKLQTKGGKNVTGYAKEVYFLNSKESNALARKVLEEKNGGHQRLGLIALRTHSWSLEWKEKPFLDSPTLSELLGIWERLGTDRGRSGQSAQQYLLMTVGPYQATNEKVRGFLEALLRDTEQSVALRSTALSEFSRGDVTPQRLAMAEWLLEHEKDVQIRRNAIGLLTTWFPGLIDSALKAKTFELLERVARHDREGEVRSAAAQAVMEFDDPKALDAVAGILDKEADAVVRSAVLKGFRWATFFHERREQLHGAQELTARIFQKDPDERVQRSAVGAYLDLVWRTLWVQDESGSSLDPRAIESIEKMVASIQERKLSAETKEFIKKKLEDDFEKKIPELSEFGQYKDLKRFLEK